MYFDLNAGPEAQILTGIEARHQSYPDGFIMNISFIKKDEEIVQLQNALGFHSFSNIFSNCNYNVIKGNIILRKYS